MSTASLVLAAALSTCPVQAEVLTAAAARIEAEYLGAAQAKAIAADVRRWRDTERYASLCGQDAAFARRFQRDLGVYDGHFMVEVVTGAPDDSWLTAWRASAVQSNAGVREVRVFESNVGYIRLSSFYGWDLAQPKLSSALNLLTDVSGLIIDLRQNGGGDGETAGHLLRALLPADVASVMSTETRAGRTARPLPAPALPAVRAEIPVVVLIDRRTGSAAEALAYALQSNGRAKLVGDRSGGAAHMVGAPRPLAHGFRMAVPETRPIDNVTGGNWEATGVIPDVRGGDEPVFVARQLLSGAPPRQMDVPR